MQWWTGGIKVESTWAWANPSLDGPEMTKPMSYTNWEENEGNKFGYSSSDMSEESDGSESCLALVAADTGFWWWSLGWREDSCSMLKHVVCEVTAI
jgi:hypothetical protein